MATQTRSEEHRKVPLKRVFSRLSPYFKPHWVAFSLGLILILVSTAIDVFKPIVVGRAVDTAFSEAKNKDLLTQLCFLFISLLSVRFFVDTLKGYLIQSTGQKITHRLRTELFTHIEHYPVSYFDINPVGRPLTRVVNDIKTLGEIFTASIAVLALDVVLITGTIGAMFWLHWKLALVILVSFPIVVWAIHYFGNKLAIAYRAARAKLSEINAFLGENIASIATIQSLAAEAPRAQKFDDITNAHFKAQMHSLKTYATMQPITNSVNGLSMASLLTLGGYWVIQGEITIGILVSFIGYIRNLFVPLRDLVEKYNQLLSAQVSAERVVSLFDEPAEMPIEVEIKREVYSKPLPISFENVSFTYPTREIPALSNVSFDLPAGKSLAIVGPTGSGKSSIVRLLMRFYEAQKGNILVGSTPIQQWKKRELRQQVGVVHQEIYLIKGTLRDNLTLSETRFGDDYLVEQSKKAQLWDLVKARGGLDTEIYEGGANFSIGERQLIGLARMLVFNPPVLILDEATASIDRLLERKLMRAISESISGRTSIVIAHRLATIEACNNVILLKDAKIQEEGSYQQLLRNGALFSKLHEMSQL